MLNQDIYSKIDYPSLENFMIPIQHMIYDIRYSKLKSSVQWMLDVINL